MYWLLMIISFVICSVITGAPVYTSMPNDKLISYLMTYKYLRMNTTNPSVIAAAITDFQMEYGLEMTGMADNKTMEAIDLPRCKMSNVMTFHNFMKNWVLFPILPKTKIFTWTIVQPNTKLDINFQNELIQKGLEKWQKKCDVIFHRLDSDNAHIRISFSHYDGPGGVLGYAYYPGDIFSGKQVYDSSENWGDGTGGTRSLSYIAAHEVGHSLGFMHSKDRKAVMYPAYVHHDGDFSLGLDDEEVCQTVFGKSINSGCFSSDNFVLLQDGRKVYMKDLEIGDIVKTTATTFSPVISMFDRNEIDYTTFITLKTKSNNFIKITGKHLIAAKLNMNGNKEFKFAENLSVGDRLYYIEDSNEFEDEIIDIHKETSKSFFAPLTFDGRIIVNNIQASCYGEIEHEQAAHWAMLPLRITSYLNSLLFKTKASDFQGVHWFGRFAKDYALSFVQKTGLLR